MDTATLAAYATAEALYDARTATDAAWIRFKREGTEEAREASRLAAVAYEKAYAVWSAANDALRAEAAREAAEADQDLEP